MSEAIIDSMLKLLDIMAKLQEPQSGCLWVQQQDFESLIKYSLEEVQELKQAVENKDYSNLVEELGDLLLQIIFYSSIGQKQNKFTFLDVINAISNKLLRRNPHIFDQKISAEYKKSSDKIAFAIRQWEIAKEKEKYHAKSKATE